MQTRLLALVSLATLAGFASTAQAQTTIVSDNFAAGTAADAGYALFGTTNTTLAVGGGDLDFAQTSVATARSGTYKQFTATSLSVGQSLTFSFDVTAMSVPGSVNHIFRWAIGTEPVTSGDQASTTPFAAGTRQMYEFAASGSATAGFSQFVAGSTSPIHTDGGGTVTAITGFTGPASITTTQTGSVSLTITRTATSDYSISQTAFGTSSSGTLTSVGYDSFNTIAFGLNSTATASVSIDNVSVSVSAIPEPSTYAALAGLGALGLAFLRRRRA